MTYDYTVLTKTKNDIDVPEFQKNARQFILDRYRTNVLFKLNVKLDYQYRDTNGDLIAEIIVTPKDF